MKPEGGATRWAAMNPHDIDDRGLTPEEPVDPAGLQHPDATLCPECQGSGMTPSGEMCPVCEGSGRATGRMGGG